MRKLFLLPILALALACDDAAVLEPEADPLFAPASRPLMVLTVYETFDQPYSGETSVTPSGIIQMRDIHNGFNVFGDLVGYSHYFGLARIDTRSGKGGASGTALYELTSPGVGTLECTWASEISGFPAAPVQISHGTCSGTGYYDDWKAKYEGYMDPATGMVTGTFEVR